MATRGLLEGDCGGQNPLNQLRSHFSKDRVRFEEGVGRGIHGPSHHSVAGGHEQDFVQEFLSQHQQISGGPSLSQSSAFNMGNLLQEIKISEESMVRETVRSDVGLANDWIGDFLQQKPPDWTDEYLEQNQSIIRQQNDQSLGWTHDFLSTVSTDVSDQALVTQNIDPEEYKQFVDSLGKSSVVNAEPSVLSSDHLVDEFLTETRAQLDTNTQAADEAYKQDFWKNLEAEWRELEAEDNHPWVQEFTKAYQPFSDYSFQEENTTKDIPNALEEGKQKFKEGDIPSAVLLFETAVQQQPELPEAWLLLGKSQAQNEQDNKAISALKRCLKLEPGNLEALMSIAVSLTNESYQRQACEALQLWLEHNPDYSHLVSDRLSTLNFTSSFMPQDLHHKVTDLYIQAARIKSGSDLDANVQAGLGVLFNLSNEYEKAVDCFRAAVASSPKDPLLWNRLGATLANGNNSEEAVSAYHSALKQNPGYVRCRYNLGISCINLKAYEAAAEHFLTALNFQATGRGPGGEDGGEASMSDTVWSSLRLGLSLMNRPDLKELADRRNLAQLSQAFNINIK